MRSRVQVSPPLLFFQRVLKDTLFLSTYESAITLAFPFSRIFHLLIKIITKNHYLCCEKQHAGMKYISKISKTEIEEFIYDAKGRMVKSSFVCPGCGNQMSEGWCFQNKDQYIMLCKPCKKLVSDELKALKKEKRKAEAQAKAAAESALLVKEIPSSSGKTNEGNSVLNIGETDVKSSPQQEPNSSYEESTESISKNRLSAEKEEENKAYSTNEDIIVSDQLSFGSPEDKASNSIESIEPNAISELDAQQEERIENKTIEKNIPPTVPIKAKDTKSQRPVSQKRKKSSSTTLSSSSEPVPFSIIFLEEDEENFKEYLRSHSSVEESTYPNIIRYLRRLKEFQWISYDKTMNFPTLHPENVSIYVDNLKHISGGEDLSEVWLLSYFRLYLYFKRNEERMKNRPKKSKTSASTTEKKEQLKSQPSSMSSFKEESLTTENNTVIVEEYVAKEVKSRDNLPTLQVWTAKRTKVKNAIIDSTLHALDKLRELLLKWRN